MPISRSPIARSNYRQLRLTATHEVNGRFSISLYAKPLNKQWSEHHVVHRCSVDGTTAPLLSIDDVLQAAIYLLETQLRSQTDDQ